MAPEAIECSDAGDKVISSAACLMFRSLYFIVNYTQWYKLEKGQLPDCWRYPSGS